MPFTADLSAPIQGRTAVRRYYPGALDTGFVTHRFLELVQQHLGLRPQQLMHADSICADDVNNIEYPALARQMLGPFSLGGLDGFPFAGLTGMGAFAHHVPDDGAVFIFYGPHIGVTKQGELGKVLRAGQAKPSACCGAAQLAVSRLLAGELQPGHVTELDYQQNQLEQLLLAKQDRIRDAERPLQEATEVLYEAIHERILFLAARTEFPCRYVIYMGGILINSDHDAGSFFDCRELTVQEPATGQLRGWLPELMAAPEA